MVFNRHKKPVVRLESNTDDVAQNEERTLALERLRITTGSKLDGLVIRDMINKGRR